jgi:hypothetical protein
LSAIASLSWRASARRSRSTSSSEWLEEVLADEAADLPAEVRSLLVGVAEVQADPGHVPSPHL